MSSDRQVVVKGGGSNLYKISESDGSFHAYKVDVHLLSNSTKSIGKARSLADALALIRSHSGKEIEKLVE